MSGGVSAFLVGASEGPRRAPSLRLLTLVWPAEIAVLTFATGGDLFSVDTARSVAFQLPELGFLTLAMAVVMLTGGINLATVAVADMSALITAGILIRAGTNAGPGVVLGAVLVGSVAATAAGALNGVAIACWGLPAILATLGTMTLFTGLSVATTRGAALSGFPDTLLALGNGSVLGVPAPMIFFLVVAVGVGFILTRTVFGRNLRMIGSNIRASGMAGVPVRATLVGVHALSGFLAGLAGLVMSARFNSAKADYGSSYLLVSILAAILGGIDPDGGFGRLSGVLLALLILQTASSGLNLLGVDQFLTGVVWGVVLIAVLAASRPRGR